MVSSKIVKYGELWIADFEPQVGEEITKKRPALILSNNLFILIKNLFLLCL